ncbi:MAG: imelysin family protein [Pseudomonadota bacterium]
MNARKVCACLTIAAALMGCGSDDDSKQGAGGSSGASGNGNAGTGGASDAGASGASDGELSRAVVVKTYAANLAAGYNDAVQDEKDFKVVVDKFLADPTQKKLEAARTSLARSARSLHADRGRALYDGPIDVDPPNNEGLVNSWPLDEAYIDYTTTLDEQGDPVVDETVGIINRPDLLPNITAAGLDELNAAGGDENISAGYHAVEFLLWGQALNETGPGERPASDYDPDGPRANAERRGQYLSVAIDGIIGHLQDVADGWTPTAEYRVGFEAAPDESLTKIFTGLAKFSKGELAGERIRAAYVSKERHDQHDCFSSKTLTDYTRDAIGIQNMYLGNYESHDGPGLDELVRAVDPEEDAKLQELLQASIDAIQAIPEPFEDSIAGADTSPGRKAIQAAINALSAQGDEFGIAAAKLGLSIMVDDPGRMIARRTLACLLVAASGCSGGAAPNVEAELGPADPNSGGDATTLDKTSQAFTNSLHGLSAEQDDAFSFGHSTFNKNWVTAPATTGGMDGLGPRFNARACSSCHSKDGRSAPFDSSNGLLGLLFRLSIPGTAENGGPNPDPVYGDQLRPRAILGVPVDGTPHVDYVETPGSYGDGETYSLQTPSYSVSDWSYGAPGDDLMISPRTGPAVIGLGLLEAVPEAEILANVHSTGQERRARRAQLRVGRSRSGDGARALRMEGQSADDDATVRRCVPG